MSVTCCFEPTTAYAGGAANERLLRMKITLLGTGTPAPSLTRQSSGYLIEVGNDVIRITSYNVCYTKLLRLLTPLFLIFPSSAFNPTHIEFSPKAS